MLRWDGYVELAVDEVRNYAGTSIQVTRRLRAMLEDLLVVAPPARRPPIEEQLRLLDIMAQRHFGDTGDAERALTADQQGIGSGADLVRGGVGR